MRLGMDFHTLYMQTKIGMVLKEFLDITESEQLNTTTDKTMVKITQHQTLKKIPYRKKGKQ